MEETKKQAGASVRLGTFVLLIILVAIAFGGAGLLYGLNAASSKTALSKTATATASATSSKTASATATVSTANWKTYTNSTYGFSFKYPSDQKIVTDSASTSEPLYTLVINNNSNRALGIDIWKTSEAAPSTLEKEKTDITTGHSNYSVNTAQIEIGGESAIKYVFSNIKGETGMGNPKASVISNGVFYSINDYGETAQTFDKILSTFQFTK